MGIPSSRSFRPLVRRPLTRPLRRRGLALSLGAALALLLAAPACATEELSEEGASVVASPNAPAIGCENLGRVVGRGGGTFGGGFVANEDLVDYALNDARNQAADKGANYLQTDPPQLGQGDGTTTTATVSGTAYRCPDGAAASPAAPRDEPGDAGDAG